MEFRQSYRTSSSDSGGEGSGPQKKIDKEQSVVVVGVVDHDNNSCKGVLVKRREEYSSPDGLDLSAAASSCSKTSSLAVVGAGSGAAGATEVLGFSGQEFDFGNMVDPESGRCRRTDGKRWRCSRNAVPLEKYCEQHMHRGRNRSRKHVESVESKSPRVELPSAKSDSRFGSCIESTITKPRHNQTMNSPVAIPDNSLSLVTTTTRSCLDKNGDSSAATTVAVAASCPAIVSSPASTAFEDVTKTEAEDGVPISSNSADKNKDEKESNNTKDSVSTDHRMSRSSEDKKHVNTFSMISIGISAESVLPVSGCKVKDSTGVELEMSRCRRTDGKKWRCKRDVLPQQKYCAGHMHRGAKRRQEVLQPVTAKVRSVVATPSNRLPFTTATPAWTKAQVASPGTKLSISISAPPQHIHDDDDDDDKSVGSNDSDTTLSDSISDYINVAS